MESVKQINERSALYEILAPCAGLEYQNSEAFQGEVWRGRDIRDVGKHKEYINFWPIPGSGLWALVHVHSCHGHVGSPMTSTPPKTYGLICFLMGSGNAPRAPEPGRSPKNSHKNMHKDFIRCGNSIVF